MTKKYQMWKLGVSSQNSKDFPTGYWILYSFYYHLAQDLSFGFRYWDLFRA
jgi:hypothetical protein